MTAAVLMRSLAVWSVAGALAVSACSTPGAPSIADAGDDALELVAFRAPTPELRALRSAYVLGAVALYASHAIERHSGPTAPADAERFIFRLQVATAALDEVRARAVTGRSRRLISSLFAIDVVELAELAIEPTARSYRDRVLGLAATPQPIAIARTAGDALRQIARVEFVREAIVADAIDHASEITTRGEVVAADWDRALEPLSIACVRLAELARRPVRSSSGC